MSLIFADKLRDVAQALMALADELDKPQPEPDPEPQPEPDPPPPQPLPPVPDPDPPTAQGSIGINLNGSEWWQPGRMFEDAARTATFWYRDGEGSFDWETGLPASGSVQMATRFQPGEVWPRGTYTIDHDAESGPLQFFVGDQTGQQHHRFQGAMTRFHVQRDAATGEYTPTFEERASAAGCLRFMDLWRTNFPDFQQQHPWTRKFAPRNVFAFRLVNPWEIVDISNDFSVDVWVCVHHKATEAHWEELARILSRCWGNVYVEHSNELWNTSFPQFRYLRNSLPDGSPYGAILAEHLRKTNLIGQVMRPASPKIKVLAGMQFWNEYSWINANKFYPDAMGLDHIDGICVAPYIGGRFARKTGKDQLLAMSDANIMAAVREDFETAQRQIDRWKQFGFELYGYEGGTHLEHGDDGPADERLKQFANSDKAAELEAEFLRYWRDNVGNTLCVFKDVGDDAWGYKPYEMHAGHPRYHEWLKVCRE